MDAKTTIKTTSMSEVSGSSRLAKWLGAAAFCGALTLVAACGGGDSTTANEGGGDGSTFDPSASEQQSSDQGDQQGPLLDEEGQLIPISDGAGVTMEIVGDDSDCPFLSTEAVLAATGSEGFAKGDFGENANSKGEYICEWRGASIIGESVTVLARNGGGGWTAESMDNPNFYGERAGGDYLMENQGPMGDFLEVWTSERFTSNYVAGDQSYIARGPYTIDDLAGNPFLELVFSWYTNTDPSEYNDVAQALLESADANYTPPPRY